MMQELLMVGVQQIGICFAKPAGVTANLNFFDEEGNCLRFESRIKDEWFRK